MSNHKTTTTASKKAASSRRKALVMASLAIALVLTSVLLVAMAPDPLAKDAAWGLFALDAGGQSAQVFDTRIPVRNGKWRYIYIHHSKTRGSDAVRGDGSAEAMGDHFLIGNGDGLGDGEVQFGVRWDRQASARPAGATLTEDCISICVVGDLDRNAPTQRQTARLRLLVQALQSHLKLPTQQVVVYSRLQNSPAGIGRLFPKDAFYHALEQ